MGVAAVLGAVGILLAAVVGSNLLGILYRPEYVRDDIFTWLMVEAAVSYQAAIMGYGVTAARWFKPQLPLALFATACIGLASLWLIPSHGLRGAATAVIIGACTKAIGGFGILTAAVRARRRAP